MNYHARAPTMWKTSLAKWFIHRADRVCSNESLFQREISKLKEIFHDNGYPEWFFQRIYNQYQLKKSETTTDEPAQSGQEGSPTPPILKVPYIGKPSILFVKRLKGVLKDTIARNTRFVYNTSKIKDHFKIKDTDPKELLTRVVYSFKCRGDPTIQYIGYTNRMLKKRVKEHLGGGSRISDHISSCHKCSSNKLTIDDFDILKKCRSWRDTAVYEAIYIKRYNPTLNIQLTKPGYTHMLKIFN